MWGPVLLDLPRPHRGIVGFRHRSPRTSWESVPRLMCRGWAAATDGSTFGRRACFTSDLWPPASRQVWNDGWVVQHGSARVMPGTDQWRLQSVCGQGDLGVEAWHPFGS